MLPSLSHMQHVAKRFKNAFCHGFVDFCDRGCIVGAQYLVKRNYHWTERFIWVVIFLATFTRGFYFVHQFLTNYAENYYRIIYEEHGHNESFQFPSVGVCEINSLQHLANVDRVLNSSVYIQYPKLQEHHEKLRNFLNIMSFQTLHTENAIRSFINFTDTLSYYSRSVLKQDLDYKKLMEQIRSPCKKFFTSCRWQNKDFDCCQHFMGITTILGKCFVLNSLQNASSMEPNFVKNIPIYEEPYRMLLTFNNPVELFLLNQRDIPETLSPVTQYSMNKTGMQLSVEFTIIPTINDDSLNGLNPNITNCTSEKEEGAIGNITYLYRSYTTCITDCFVAEQWKTCGCINMFSVKPKAPFCNLTQYACLEENGFINARSSSRCGHCIPNCDDTDFVVENLYYNINNSTLGKYSLEVILLNIPTIRKRRQAIRQEEDKLVSLSGILCLFLGANLITVIEFLYLVCRAYARRQLPPPPPALRRPTPPRGGYCQRVGNVLRKAIKLSPHKP